jgi:hypothetical protein
LVCLFVLLNCSSNESPISGFDAGPISGFDAGPTEDASCEIVSTIRVSGMTDPSYLPKVGDADLLEDPDPDRLTVTYNGGEPIKVISNGLRTYYVDVCAGPAVIDVRHTVSGEPVGHVEWDASRVKIPDVGDYSDGAYPNGFPDSFVVAYGAQGGYRLDRIPIQWQAPEGGKWRFHIFNAWTEDTLSLSLFQIDPSTRLPLSEEEDPYQQSVVTNLAPLSSTVVEVDHPFWHDLHEDQIIVTLLVFRDLDPDGDLPLYFPFDASPYKIANPPDGSIITILMYPQFLLVLGMDFFECRDPLMRHVPTEMENCGT